MRFASLFVLVALAPLVLSGCVVAAAGAAGYGAVQYLNNEAQQVYSATLPSAWNASLAALAEIGTPVARPPVLGPTEGTIRSGEWWVRVEELPGTRVRVRVRVGTFSTAEHRRRAALFLEALERRLGS